MKDNIFICPVCNTAQPAHHKCSLPQVEFKQVEGVDLRPTYEELEFVATDRMNTIMELKQEIRELRAVVQGYDKVINQLPKEELVRFANAFPEKFREALAHKEDK